MALKVFKTSDTHRGFSQRTIKIHNSWAKRFHQEEWDAIVLAGDIASHRKFHFYAALRWWRQQAGDKPILLARGNHDLWDESQNNLVSLRNKLHHEWFQEFDIHHLESMGPHWIGDTCFVGWDGWYCHRANSNDMAHMNRWVHGDTWGWMTQNAMFGFDAALTAAQQAKTDGAKVVAVTHFPIIEGVTAGEWSGNFSYWNIINKHIDVFMYGHSHRPVNQVIDGVQVINSGSDYERPKHTIITCP